MSTHRSVSRNAGALNRLQQRKRKRHSEKPAPLRSTPAYEAPSGAPESLFSTSLVLTFPHKEKSRWLTVPVALSVHLAVFLTLTLLPIFFPEQVEPQLVKLHLYFAPPPPPPLLAGSPLVLERPSDVVPQPQPDDESEDQDTEERPRQDRLSIPTEIPEEILKPHVQLQKGIDEGSEFGHPLGMEGGVPGGVVGGVPGGILGGVIGGTGTDVPRSRPDVGPSPIRMPRPTYTVEALRKKVSGEVVLSALIDVRGRVRVLRIIRSVPELDQEAVRVVEQEWLFRPAMKNGRPIESLAVLTVNFNLL